MLIITVYINFNTFSGGLPITALFEGASLDLGFSVSYSSRVRLFGIDTPESRTRNKDEKVRGLMSKQYLIDELAKGQVVIKTKKDKK